MDLLFYRYRHVTALLVAILVQLGVLAYQVRNDRDVRLIRVWAVSAVTPLARVLDGVRSGTTDFIDDYLLLLNVRKENQRLKKELGAAQLEIQHAQAQLETARVAQALALFQKETPMKTLPARIFMNTTGSSSAVFVDVGSVLGVERGMAVITPAGIVGKITAVYPTASMVLLMSDPLFAAGVVSQKNRVQGTLRGQGSASPIVDFVQNEQKVDVDEWFYTSGNDFVFPRGLRVGTAAIVRDGNRRKEIQIKPSAFDTGIEEVLIITSGVHATIPQQAPPPNTPISLQTPPKEGPIVAAGSPAGAVTTQSLQTGPAATDADKIADRYRSNGTVKSATKPQVAPSASAPTTPAATTAPRPTAPQIPPSPPPAPLQTGSPSPASPAPTSEQQPTNP
jgi:rod shape-determining protein MreC